ncbi:MAG: hypothetical protein Q4D86_10175 [Pasteurella oralis]|uniref:hypothetical protein n=1 Tax=Pasteurella oralis TaxID=1071947 RepID=UPI0027103B4C|nr:hypothetical protein [Pasteurella oralis]
MKALKMILVAGVANIAMISSVQANEFDEIETLYRQGNYKALYPKLKKLTEKTNHPILQYNLAGLYFNAQGTPKDNVAAYYWWDKSCNANFTPACNSLHNSFGGSLIARLAKELHTVSPKKCKKGDKVACAMIKAYPEMAKTGKAPSSRLSESRIKEIEKELSKMGE